MFFRKLIIVLFATLLTASNIRAAAGAEGLATNLIPATQLRLKKTGKPDSWFGEDKLAHFVFSAFACSLAYGTLHYSFEQPQGKSLLLGGSFTFALGISKEVYDAKSTKGHASVKDLVADLLGVGLSIILIRSL